MSVSNTLSPTTAGSDPDVGASGSWINVSNIVSSNNTYAAATITSVATQIVDKEVKLRIGFDDEFSISLYAPSNLASGTWGTTDAYASYGSDTQTWGTTLTEAVVESIHFGLGMSCQTSDAVPLYTNTLYGSDFGFQIPSRAKIWGVSARIERNASWNSRVSRWSMNVDHYELTVHYSVFIPKINMRFFSWLALLVQSFGLFGIHGIEAVSGGILLKMRQTKGARQYKYI